MLQGANSTGKGVAKTKLANIKSKNARASSANITMLFPPDTMWRRGWSYVQYATYIKPKYSTNLSSFKLQLECYNWSESQLAVAQPQISDELVYDSTLSLVKTKSNETQMKQNILILSL